MTVDERIKVASEKVDRVVNLINRLLYVRACNDLVVYSDLLSKQVKPSIAANAFNLFTSAMYNAELLGICAIWDAADCESKAKDRDSLPALKWLVQHPTLLSKLQNSIEQNKLARPVNFLGDNHVPSEVELRDLRLQAAREDKQQVETRYHEANNLVQDVVSSDVLKGIRNFRDKHVAHSLALTAAEKKGPVPTPKYGHEKELTTKAIEAVDRYYFILCDSSFSWPTARENASRAAKALWNGCELTISE